MDFLHQHSALVVGASRGIGRDIAVTLATHGASVALMARDKKELQQTAHQCEQAGSNAFPIPIDVMDSSAIEPAITQAVTQLNGLDIVIFSQGLMHRGLMVEDTQDRWRDILSVNLLSCMHMTRLTLPYLYGKHQTGKKRAIIYIASIAGKQPFAGGAAYCASKYGLIGFAHSVFEEVREQGIKIAAICPGYVNTDMVTNTASLNREKMIQPADISEVIINILQSAANICPVEITVRPQFSPYQL